MKYLRSIKVAKPLHVEMMRQIYNENLEMLATIPLSYRNYEDQQIWWNANKAKMKAYLYEPKDRPGKIVGFSVLTDRDGFYTPIIAIQKEEWGKGYGKEIIKDYIYKAKGPLAGTQLKSNLSICHLNKKYGWQIIDTISAPGGEIELLYHPGIVKVVERNGEEIRQRIMAYLRNKYK